MSKGTERVGLGLPLSTPEYKLKLITAELIDICEEMRSTYGEAGSEHDLDVQRYISLAQTAYEEACMWVMKAAALGR